MPIPGAADEIGVEVNGVIAEDGDPQLQAQFAGRTMTPTATFQFIWNQSTISYNAGDSQVVTPDLLAALTAAGAPFTQP